MLFKHPNLFLLVCKTLARDWAAVRRRKIGMRSGDRKCTAVHTDPGEIRKDPVEIQVRFRRDQLTASAHSGEIR